MALETPEIDIGAHSSKYADMLAPAYDLSTSPSQHEDREKGSVLRRNPPPPPPPPPSPPPSPHDSMNTTVASGQLAASELQDSVRLTSRTSETKVLHGPTKTSTNRWAEKRIVSLDKALRKQEYNVGRAKEEAKQRRYRADMEASRREAISREKYRKHRLAATAKIRTWLKQRLDLRMDMLKKQNDAAVKIQSLTRRRRILIQRKRLQKAIIIVQCAARIWLSKIQYRVRFGILQYGRWDYTQASRVTALVSGWRIRRLMRFSIVQKRRKKFSDMIKLIQDLRTSTKVRTGDMELLATLRVSIIPERRQFRGIVLGDRYENKTGVDPIHFMSDSTTRALMGDRCCRDMIMHQLQHYLIPSRETAEASVVSSTSSQNPSTSSSLSPQSKGLSHRSPKDGRFAHLQVKSEKKDLLGKRSDAIISKSSYFANDGDTASQKCSPENRDETLALKNKSPLQSSPVQELCDRPWQDLDKIEHCDTPAECGTPLPDRKFKSAYLQADVTSGSNLQPAAIRSGSYAALADRLPYVRCELKYYIPEDADTDKVAAAPKQRQLIKIGRPPALPSLAPDWNESMVWPLKSPRDRNGAELKATKSNALLRYWRKSSLIIQIWDHDRFNIDQFLGEVKIPLCELTSTSKNPELTDGSCHEPTTISGWFELKARTPRDRVKGSILIRVTLFPSFESSSAKSATSPSHTYSGEIMDSDRDFNEASNDSAAVLFSDSLGPSGERNGVLFGEPTEEQMARRKFNANKRRQRLAVLAKTLDKVSENLRRTNTKEDPGTYSRTVSLSETKGKQRNLVAHSLDWSAVKARTDSQWRPGEIGHDATRRHHRGTKAKETWRRIDLSSLKSSSRRKIQNRNSTPDEKQYKSVKSKSDMQISTSDADALWQTAELGHLKRSRSTLPLVHLETMIWGNGESDNDFWSKLGEMFTMDENSDIFQLGAGRHWRRPEGLVPSASANSTAQVEDESEYARSVAMGSAEYHNLKRQQQALYRQNYYNDQASGGENARFRSL